MTDPNPEQKYKYLKIVENDDLSVTAILKIEEMKVIDYLRLKKLEHVWLYVLIPIISSHFVPVHQRLYPNSTISRHLLSIFSENKFVEVMEHSSQNTSILITVSPTTRKIAYTVEVQDLSLDTPRVLFKDRRTHSVSSLSVADAILDDVEEKLYGLDPLSPLLTSSTRRNFFRNTAEKNLYKRKLRENLTSLGIDIKILAVITKRTTGILRITMSYPDKDQLCLFWKLFDWADASVKNMAIQPWVD